MRVGIVGYSASNFDHKKANDLIENVFSFIEKEFSKDNLTLVGGYTDLGINSIAYRIAAEKGWATVGIACEKAHEYELYPVDRAFIAGEDWGDESFLFLDNIDILVRVGGGKQSLEETEMAKKLGLNVYEYDLPMLETECV